ncbi:CCA tRNA nucleotidyltransferase [Planctomicrobium sp. SH527]|uniref:CCA tRNA nucleotidyltransferase n=1 Tax=Planctomicrobium sp. SH527 TaxID=3448123 RepID=UPI003F5BE54A
MPRLFATTVVQELTNAGFLAYWAGGCVRDFLRGVEPHDYDVATNARPEQVRELFGRNRTLAVGESFGVVIVLGPKGTGISVEVATFRQDGTYLDGRRPDHVEFCGPEDDAQRRDFTINGLFFNPLTETVHDYVGGQADLERKIIRAIGNPQDRMTEDKLRMLRAVRFTAILNFQLDEATAQAIQGMADQVTVVSAERIAQEFRKMLPHVHRALAVNLCSELGLMPYVMPEVYRCSIENRPDRWAEILQILRELITDDFTTVMAALLRDTQVLADKKNRGTIPAGTVSSACNRLKLSNQETTRICWLTSNKYALETLFEQPISALKRFASQSGFGELFHLERTAARVEGRSDEPYAWIEARLQEIPVEELDPPPLLTGDDLIRHGFKAGPRFKDLLDSVRDAQLNGQLHSTDDAIAWLLSAQK